MFSPQTNTRFRDALESLQNAHDKLDAQLVTNEEIMAREALISLCRTIAAQDDSQDDSQDVETLREGAILGKQAVIDSIRKNFITTNSDKWIEHPSAVIASIERQIIITKQLIAHK